MHSDVLVDGGDQFRDTAKDAAFQSVGRDAAEEALDHVEPGGGGWREVHDEAGMPGQPLLHRRMLVGGVVVGDEVQCFVPGRLAVDLLQEFQPLSMGVPLLALPMT